MILTKEIPRNSLSSLLMTIRSFGLFDLHSQTLRSVPVIRGPDGGLHLKPS